MKPYVLIKESGSTIETINVIGELDLASAHDFETTINALNESVPSVVIDMSACHYIDSTIIAVLIRAHRRFGNKLMLVIPQKNTIRRLFRIANLDTMLQIEPSIEAANVRITTAL